MGKDVTDAFYVNFPTQLDMEQIATEHSLPAHQLREIITGENAFSVGGTKLSPGETLLPLNAQQSETHTQMATANQLLESASTAGSAKTSKLQEALSESVLAQLSAEDRQTLKKMETREAD